MVFTANETSAREIARRQGRITGISRSPVRDDLRELGRLVGCRAHRAQSYLGFPPASTRARRARLPAARAAAGLAVAGEPVTDAVELVVRQDMRLAELRRVPGL